MQPHELISMAEDLESLSRRCGQFATQLRVASGNPLALQMLPTMCDLNFGMRIANVLESNGIVEVAQLLNHSPLQLLQLANFGVTSLNTMRRILETHGLYLRNDRPETRG